ncbi:UNVERIFIED_CONTAM: hypothetical protein Sradi_1612200 [Sesamum radiatum]|uniref:Disease resistance R13L4/SHOC-2-like LRR domain-containing protein n=1 Tax=Sesamum radiatum TaxID=300843 RepID=A0AAW2UCS5_SESRA
MEREQESSISKTRRSAIHLDELDNDSNYSIGENRTIRTLLFLQKEWHYRNWRNCITFGIFKFLKVLILEGYEFENGKLPEGIEKLNLLKLLSIEDSVVKELPPSIFKLPCLQSLNLQIRVLSDIHISLPNSIYKMRRLKHLFMEDGHQSIGGGKLKLEGLNELETIVGFNSLVDDVAHLLKLQKLGVSGGTICDEDSLSMIVDHILNHQDQFRSIRLTILGDTTIDSKDSSTLLRRLMMCHALNVLYIEARVRKLPAYEVLLYQNVTELRFWKSKIEEDPMKILSFPCYENFACPTMHMWAAR